MYLNMVVFGTKVNYYTYQQSFLRLYTVVRLHTHIAGARWFLLWIIERFCLDWLNYLLYMHIIMYTIQNKVGSASKWSQLFSRV